MRYMPGLQKLIANASALTILSLARELHMISNQILEKHYVGEGMTIQIYDVMHSCFIKSAFSIVQYLLILQNTRHVDR